MEREAVTKLSEEAIRVASEIINACRYTELKTKEQFREVASKFLDRFSLSEALKANILEAYLAIIIWDFPELNGKGH